ncbi:MAG: MFS transporter [Gordonia sp. (in: high G+C Gram-positive bacteria)]|uniref:MFS transporter n=1 Tax=Gordonia sp. (in: high G+C Gram-positive bacteria) TaxID=84139 RepID=UPI0039E6C7AB
MSLPDTVPAERANPQIAVVLAAAFLGFLAQMTLNPIIAPLSREVGLAEWQVGVTISTAAIMVVLTAQRWGRTSQRLGRKRVLLGALGLGAVATAAFTLVARFGMTGVLGGTALFVLFVLLRGVAFGTAIAAVQPTAQAFIADVTDDEAARVKGMASVGAVNGIAQIAGAVLGGALAALGLLAPLVAVPVLLTVGVLLVATRLRPEDETVLIETPVKVRPTDPRVWPFLAAGFGIFTAVGFVQIITGFLVQDRLGLDAKTTGVLTGAALLAVGLGMILAQAVVVPKSGWGPGTLLRVGCGVAVLGFLLYVPDAGPLLFAALFVAGLGVGIAMPGYTAGPSLLVSREEQGGLAGLIAANTALTFVLAPTLATALYSAWAPLPVIVGTVIMAAVTAFVLVHPRFRSLPAEPVETADTPIP